MKKKTFLFYAVLSVLLSSCSSNIDETKVDTSSESELILKGKKFARVHNECLDYIYENTHKPQTRATNKVNGDLFSDIVDTANSFIAEKVAKTRTTSDGTMYVTKEMYDSITIEDIKAQMSPIELEYTNMAVENINCIESLINQVAYDAPELSDIQKQAVICFLTTLESSLEYWQENIDKWKSDSDVGAQTRGHFEFNWKEVAFADAYWGYTGMLSSGLNIYVGGGAAAVGSAFACLK